MISKLTNDQKDLGSNPRVTNNFKYFTSRNLVMIKKSTRILIDIFIFMFINNIYIYETQLKKEISFSRLILKTNIS